MTYPTVSHTGAPWRPGLPPGVYEDRPRRATLRDVRMDVAAFIGLTERGPVSVPVAVASWDEYRHHFGDAGGGRLLPQSVALFFANGGRRCVVVRVLDYGAATTALWRLPGLGVAGPGGGPPAAAGAEVHVAARNPGAWGNFVRLTVSFEQRRKALFLPGSVLTHQAPPGEALDERWLVAQNGERLTEGALIRFVRRENDTTAETFRFVREVRPLPSGHHAIAFHEPLSVDWRETAAPASDADGGSPFVDEGDVLGDPLEAGSEEISVRLEVSIDGERELWPDLALHPAHPRFLVRRLSRRCASELYQRPRTSAQAPAAPAGSTLIDELDVALLVEDNERDQTFLDVDSRRAGSMLVRFPRASWNQALLPARDDASTGAPRSVLFTRARWSAAPTTLVAVGSDGAGTTARGHFFAAPGAPPGADPADLEFIDQPPPLEAIDAYDERNETEPVSLVSMPDLAHPRRLDTFDDLPPVAAEPTLVFQRCEEPARAPAPVEDLAYPLLTMNLLHEIHLRQRELVAHCEARADRIAVLDLPPGLTSGEIVQWRRRLGSSRAALYVPYLRCQPVQAPEADLMTVPPSGAACGIIALRERLRGVHVAPANTTVRGVVALFDEQSLPGAGFLHEERVNAMRLTERGIDLLGSRTTSSATPFTHLSVRRLIDHLARQLTMDARWAVFEPANHVLWTRLRQTVERRLAPLYRAGAFAGPTAADSYFVRCDAETNSRARLDAGETVVLVGVAPSVPAEFIVFRLTRRSDGTTELEETHA